MTVTTDDTFTTPEGEVTDHDPGAVQWTAAHVAAEPIEGELLGSCAFEEGQTHRTVVGFYEWEADDIVDGMPMRATRQAAIEYGSDDGDGYWSTYALVPAAVRDDAAVRPPGDPWSDLLCVLALVSGRPGTNPSAPLRCDRGVLTLNVDADDFTGYELAQLSVWGFRVGTVDDGGGLWSRRFGGLA